MPNIIFVGYRGSGKTSVAEELAEKLKLRVLSTDREFENKFGPISNFVKKSGWDEFRKLESELIKKINADNLIIDCGGGVVENKSNINYLRKNGIVFWLKTDAKTISERIKDSGRLSLTGKKSASDEVGEVLKRRIPLYRKAADFEIDSNRKSIAQVSNELLNILNQNKMNKGANINRNVKLNRDFKMKQTILCAVVTASNIKNVISELKKTKDADIVELRLDFIKGIDKNNIKNLLKNARQKIIATCRPAEFGGKFTGTEKERIEILKSAIENGADFVDIEFESKIAGEIISSNKKSIRKKKSGIILSHHDFEKTPNLKSLKKIYNEIKKLNPDFVKIVTAANSINDNFAVFELLKNKNDLISFCMGIKGEISRILAAKFNSRITYASIENGKESAPGQITLEEMNNLYHAKLINPETNVIGIIGEFAENSMSKYMHNPNFAKNNLNFVYVPLKTAKNELGEFIGNFRKFNFKGAAVTVPHKENIIQYLDKVDKTAKEIGAVNTIVNNNGILTGYNTDYFGAVCALKEKIKLKRKKVLVIGGGGAARAVAYGLKKENAGITLTNRSNGKAQKLAEEFKINFGGFEDIDKLIMENEVIINTTSAGMAPNANASAIGGKELKKGKIVMDIVYKPINTKLIKLAEKKGCMTITGDRMLLYQAVRQFELWTGTKPDFKSMEKELINQINKLK